MRSGNATKKYMERQIAEMDNEATLSTLKTATGGSNRKILIEVAE